MGVHLKSNPMREFHFPTSSLKYAMSVAAFPGGMQGARIRLRLLPLSLIGWGASCNININKCWHLSGSGL